VKIISRLSLFLLLLAAVCGASLSQGDRPKPLPEVQALLDEGKKAAAEFKWEDALTAYGKGLKKAEELNDQFGQGKAWQMLGNTYYGRGDLVKAQDCFSQAKGLFAKAGAKDDELGMLGNLAILKDNMGYPDEARPIYLQLLAHYREVKDKPAIARMLLNLGILESNVGHYPEAMKYGEEARAAFRDVGDKRWEASSLAVAADALHMMGRSDEAIECYFEVVKIAREGKYKQQEGTGLASLGNIYRIKGDLLVALDYLKQALKIREETGDVRFQAKTLTSIGVVYDLLGQSRLAFDSMKRAIEIQRRLGDRPSLATSLTNLGVSFGQAKRDDEAMPCLEEALELNRQIGDKLGAANCLATIGAIHRRAKRFDAALANQSLALGTYREMGRKEEQATVLDTMASVYVDQKRFDEAIANYKQAIVLYGEIHNTRFAATTWGNMGVAQVKMGKLTDAEASFKKCIAMTEDVRARLGASSEGKAEFLGRRVDVYHQYIALLVKLGRVGEAYDLAQKTKGRALLDLLNSGSVSIQQGMTAAERTQERELRRQADQLSAQMVREGAINEVGAKQRYAKLQGELAQAENKLAAFMSGVFAKHSGLAQKRSASTANLAQVAARLPRDTALLEYISADEPLVFVVSSNGGKPNISCKQLGMKGDELRAQCSALRNALSTPGSTYMTQAAGLHKALIAPIAEQVKGKKRLVVCPDGPLWDIPFAALSDGKFLAEKFEIEYGYSGTAVEASLRPRELHPGQKSLLVLANPDFGGAARFGDNPLIPGQRPIEPPSRPIDPPSRPIDPPSRPIEPPSRDLAAGLLGGIAALPGTQREADALAKLYPKGTVLTKDRAQESSFVQSAGEYRYIHIASHAFFNDASPMLSSIVLAIPSSDKYDGYLTAREITDMKLNAELVVLSACNTARGEKTSGEGIVGLSWALFVAGTPSQVVSQWSVDDKATAELMTRFYANMKKGEPKGAALNRASLSLLKSKDPKWRHPYYWAPFVLLGDWR
jgi:CHAT domain-containing protein